MNRISFSGLTQGVSALGFGCTSIGTAIKGDDATRLVADYLSAGGNHLDTAHCYSFWEKDGLGASERETGRIVRELGVRSDVIIATKGGHPEAGAAYRRPSDFLNPSVLFCDLENSLYRLGVETIDFYYLHRDDGKTPVSELIEALNSFIRRGWIRSLGASNWSTIRIAEANAYAAANHLQGFVISQIQGSLAAPNHVPDASTPEPTHRHLDSETAAWHKETGIPVAAFSATASGYFAENPGPGASPLYDNRVSQARRDRARRLAAELGVTPVQIAFAYLLCQPDFPILPLFSTTRREHLTEILAAQTIALTPEQIVHLRDG